MSTQNPESAPESADASAARPDNSTIDAIKESVSDASTKASALAHDLGGQAKGAITDVTTSLGSQMRDMLDEQLNASWEVVGQVTESFKLVADDLDQKSPVAAGVVRTIAEKVDGYAQGLRDQSVEQVLQTASSFTRRQPAVVFGLAAVAGFLLLRTINSAQANTGASSAPSHSGAERSHYG